MKQNYGENLYILLDDPGLSLHAKAQADLLRYIKEKLIPNYQVMYSTHSPFMIDPDNLLEVRTVEDKSTEDEIIGTQVEEEILKTEKDTIFPLQASLGYDITQTLFIGKNTLLVEGPSDLLYINWFSHELKSRGRVGLDPRWIIAPSGGIGKINSFMALFKGNKLNVCTLVDYSKGQKTKVRQLRESKILITSNILTVNIYAGQEEADIEDIISREFYLTLVNDCFDLKAPNILLMNKLQDTPIRVLEEVEKHFIKIGKEFDHYTPALYLTEKGSKMNIPKINEALDRFEKLFRDINNLLPN